MAQNLNSKTNLKKENCRDPILARKDWQIQKYSNREVLDAGQTMKKMGLEHWETTRKPFETMKIFIKSL